VNERLRRGIGAAVSLKRRLALCVILIMSISQGVEISPASCLPQQILLIMYSSTQTHYVL
jgi:hypothetical protein